MSPFIEGALVILIVLFAISLLVVATGFSEWLRGGPSARKPKKDER